MCVKLFTIYNGHWRLAPKNRGLELGDTEDPGIGLPLRTTPRLGVRYSSCMLKRCVPLLCCCGQLLAGLGQLELWHVRRNYEEGAGSKIFFMLAYIFYAQVHRQIMGSMIVIFLHVSC